VATRGDGRRLTRRQFVALGGSLAAGVLAPGAVAGGSAPAGAADGGSPGPLQFVTRRDLQPPPVTVAARNGAAAPGYILLAPFDITGQAPASRQYGPLIVDDTGEPVWFKPLAGKSAMGLRVQRYRGKPVLTWYEGQVLGPYGGDFVIADTSYREVLRVKAAHGFHADLHEILLTTRGTALITIYQEIASDLTSVGGPVDGRLVEGIVQELQLPSGHVLFEWRSSEHVAVDESFQTQVTKAGNVDYFHLNSIGVDLDANLLVSARHTSAVYKLDRSSGEVLWRLGGKKSDFEIEPAAQFSYQHDVRRQSDGSMTIFDNAAAEPDTSGDGSSSRPIRIALDETARTARLLEVLETPDPRLAWAMGNLQELTDGGSFVGWGTVGSFTEFAADGGVRFDASFADGSVTYRAFRFPWAGQPRGRPSVTVRKPSAETMVVYASWNGATAVHRWQVRVGTSRSRLRTVLTTHRRGFETAISLRRRTGYLSVAALDATGKLLGASATVRV
jgi:Arylsulfotransferase (ASST)